MEPPPVVDVTVRVNGSTRRLLTRGADVSREVYKNLDKEIGALVQWCLASAEDRPDIETLHNCVNELRRKATPSRYAGYPLAQWESDSEIRRIVQRHILDA